ncbi:MAG: TolC family protein [Candidatus Obscuribacterales bacterium]|nr:TolC family protein [Candidatus Obscuribacterales bacterium]
MSVFAKIMDEFAYCRFESIQLKSNKYIRSASLAFLCLGAFTSNGQALEQDTSQSKTNTVAATSRAQTELLSPVQIQNQFGQSDIPVTSQKSALREPTMTLKGAVEEAAVSNKDIKKAQSEVSRFKWDYVASQAGRLPNLRVISYLAQQTVTNTLVPRQADAFVFASFLVPITQQYRLGLEARAIKLGREIAAYKLEQEVDDTKAKVKASYYKLVLDQSQLSSIGVSIKYLTELEITVSNRVKEGNALKVDAMQVAAKLAKSRLDETKARNTFQIDREKFNHLLGRNLQSNISLEAIPQPDDLELNVHESEQRALSNRPEIRAADARMKQLHLEKKIRLAEYIPNVSIGAVYISLPGFNNQVVPKNIFAPGIFINYNAFDWGRKAFLAKAQAKSEQAASLNLDSIKEEVLIDLHSQINKLTEARESVKTTEFARNVALEELRVSMNRYKFTSEKLAEVLAAQALLADASNNYHQSLLSFWEAKAEFDRAVGE